MKPRFIFSDSDYKIHKLEEIEKIILLSSGFECSIAFFMNLSMMGEILL